MWSKGWAPWRSKSREEYRVIINSHHRIATYEIHGIDRAADAIKREGYETTRESRAARGTAHDKELVPGPSGQAWHVRRAAPAKLTRATTKPQLYRDDARCTHAHNAARLIVGGAWICPADRAS